MNLINYLGDSTIPVFAISHISFFKKGDKTLILCPVTLDYSRPSIIQTSLIRTLDYPNYQINDIRSICGVHQIELTAPPLKTYYFTYLNPNGLN